jgi:putative oxidoreductase
MKTFIKSIIPACLILLFTYAAISKLSDLPAFRSQLYRQPFSHMLADLLLYTLPLAELLTSSMLYFKRTRFTGLLLSVSLLFAFTIYIAMGLLHFWVKIPCSCGGILNHMSWQMHLIFNCAFLLAGLAGIAVHWFEKSPTSDHHY